MHPAENTDLQSHHAELIAEALTTEGGHLSIGRGGFILWYRDGCRLLGHDSEPIKAACIEAGLPVIDSRGVAFDAVARLVIRGPMVAPGPAAAWPVQLCAPGGGRGDLPRRRRRGGQPAGTSGG